VLQPRVNDPLTTEFKGAEMIGMCRTRRRYISASINLAVPALAAMLVQTGDAETDRAGSDESLLDDLIWANVSARSTTKLKLGRRTEEHNQ
jgi:hypothetical protein